MLPTKAIVLPAEGISDPLSVVLPAKFSVCPLFTVTVAPVLMVRFLANEEPSMAGKKGTPAGICTSVVIVGTPPHQFAPVVQLAVVPSHRPIGCTVASTALRAPDTQPVVVLRAWAK